MIKRVQLFRAALLSAVALAGCNAPMPTADAPGMDPAVNMSSARYELLAAAAMANPTASASAAVMAPAPVAASASLAIASVEASSVLNDYFRVAYVNDGNVHSAWAPAAEDHAPCLTFHLSERANLSSFAIKMSHADCTVDVAVCDHGVWSTIATDLSPTRTVLDTLKVKNAMCNQVKLTFRGADCANLKVCEVQLYANGSATPLPAPLPKPAASAVPSQGVVAQSSQAPVVVVPVGAPSQGPVALPSLVPVVLPSLVPVVSVPAVADCCKVTGGGFVALGDGHGHNKVSFGFVAMGDAQGAKGNIEVNDHVSKAKFHGRVTAVHCDSHSATFTGTLDAGGTFSATVVDNGEPGRGADRFSFAASTGFQIAGVLGGGNIKLHANDCEVGRAHERALCDEVVKLGIACDVDASETFHVNLADFDQACDRGDFDVAVAAHDDEHEMDRDHADRDHHEHEAD